MIIVLESDNTNYVIQNLSLKFRQSYYFRETWLFFLENFDGFQLPLSLILSAENLHTFPTYQCLQKGVQNFLIFLETELLINLVPVSV